MRILIAPDKFKGSLSAREAAAEIAAGIRDVLPTAELVICPIADGGEGTAEIIREARTGEWITVPAHDALGRRTHARFAWMADSRLAVFDLAEVAGLSRLAADERDPTATSTFGVGELLLAAEQHGAANIIVGLGGSATNDGGFGMARALDVGFFDEQGAQLTRPAELRKLRRLEEPEVLHVRTTQQRCRRVRGCRLLATITAAADVNNPLLGPNGATRTFGRQKGANAQQIELLEAALANLADVVARDLGRDVRDLRGAGAAGGLGFGLMAFCRATVRSGFDVVAEQIGLEAAVREADVVVTGEGRLDPQTLYGKAPAGVARLARSLGKKCYAIAGEIESTPQLAALFDGMAVAAAPAVSRAEAMRNARALLRDAAARLGALLRQRDA